MTHVKLEVKAMTLETAEIVTLKKDTKGRNFGLKEFSINVTIV